MITYTVNIIPPMQIATSQTLRAFFISEALWHHQGLIKDFPLPLFVRKAMQIKRMPRMLRVLVAHYVLWQLDRKYRPSVHRMYELLNSEKVKEIITAIECKTAERFQVSIPINTYIVVTPHEWALSSDNAISLGIRPPELLEHFSTNLLRHEFLHIAFAYCMRTWKSEGFTLRHPQEATEVAIALLTQEYETGIPELHHYSRTLRTFATDNHEELRRLRNEKLSPRQLLAHVDELFARSTQ
ncbi:MAG: hypothetical protein QY311_00665 [Candidatus Paceibacterota bacterium]|nr:MAG: hypothetical protein QY311_00665 [Candidatus Paceibacterota bacterium]